MARQPIWKKIYAKFHKRPIPNAGRRAQTIGHRGIAIGSLEQPDLSAENVEQWKLLTPDETTDFLFNGSWLNVHSTNVQALKYDGEKGILYVRYHSGQTWAYGDVDEQTAIYFVTTPSKGEAVWDELRIRGTKHGHRRPAWTVAG